MKQLNLTAKSALLGALVQLQICILNPTNCKALFGKESCQRQLTERLKNKCFNFIFRFKIANRTNCKLALPVQGRVSAKPTGGLSMCTPAVCIGVQ